MRTGIATRWAHLMLLMLIGSIASAEDWPHWRGERRDGSWRSGPIIDTFPGDTAELTWRTPIGAGYSGPTVSAGRVFVTDRVTEPVESERIHCFQLDTGDRIWSRTYACSYAGISYQAGPRASVSVDQQRAYSLGATGQLYCLNVEDGETIWHRDLNADYDISRDDDQTRMPVWGIAASPLVAGDRVVLHIGGRDGACVVALDALTGNEIWRALDDRAQYSAPILVRQAGRDVVVVWTGDSVAGIDLQTGEVHWRHVLTPTRMPIGIATPVVQGDQLFVTSFYDGSLMLRLAQGRLSVSEVWRAQGRNEKNTQGLHSIISTPIWLGDHIYGVDSYGELRCLEAATGQRVWEDRSATPRARWSTIHFTRHADDVWMFNERGELIIGRLTPAGFHERSRTKLLTPTQEQLRQRGGVCWAHPAFAQGRVIARNDQELVCFDLRAEH